MDPVSQFSTGLYLSLNSIENPHYKEYNRAFLDFKEHLLCLINPYVALDVFIILKKYKNECLDTLNLYSDFSSLSAPQETKDALCSLSKKLSSYISSLSRDQINDASEKVREKFIQLVNEIELILEGKISSHWNELKLLLCIPQIRETKTPIIKNIFNYIKDDQRELLHEVVDSLINIELSQLLSSKNSPGIIHDSFSQSMHVADLL